MYTCLCTAYLLHLLHMRGRDRKKIEIYVNHLIECDTAECRRMNRHTNISLLGANS